MLIGNKSFNDNLLFLLFFNTIVLIFVIFGILLENTVGFFSLKFIFWYKFKSENPEINLFNELPVFVWWFILLLLLFELNVVIFKVKLFWYLYLLLVVNLFSIYKGFIFLFKKYFFVAFNLFFFIDKFLLLLL